MSGGGILHLGRLDDLIAEVAAQLCRRSEVDLPPKPLTELDFHARHGDVSHPRPFFELHQHIDIALGPKTVCQNRPEKREFANLVSLAEVSDELRIELRPLGCYSSSCTETVIGKCSVEEAAGNYVASAQICLLVDSSGICTDDCGGAPSPRCESETPLSAGTHTVRLGNFSVEFEVPSELSGARCSGFL